MKIKPKEVLVNLPIVLLLDTEDTIPQLASNFNTFLHGKTKLKYEMLGMLNGQCVGLFYLQRNDEFHQLREEFVKLIENEEIAIHAAKKAVCHACRHDLHVSGHCHNNDYGQACYCNHEQWVVGPSCYCGFPDTGLFVEDIK